MKIVIQNLSLLALLITSTCQAAHLIDADNFKEQIKQKSDAQWPELFFNLCWHKVNHNQAMDLEFFEKYLPENWNNWSLTEKKEALERIKDICATETEKAARKKEPTFPYKTLEKINQTEQNEQMRYYNFVRNMTPQQRNAILNSGINMIDFTKPNFTDFASLYPEIGCFPNEPHYSIYVWIRHNPTITTLTIQQLILEAIEKIKNSEELLSLYLSKQTPKNHPIGIILRRLTE